jgi:hypothetical protein
VNVHDSGKENEPGVLLTANLRWRALIIIEHLFLHVKPFRKLLLSQLHRFLEKTLNSHDIITERALISLGLFLFFSQYAQQNKI